MATQIKIRRDTAANFTSADPILAQGEPALETDTLKQKIGDGTTAWTSLAYIGAGVGDMVLADVQTVTGAKTFEDAKLLLRNVADTFSAKFTNVITAARTYTLQDASGTLAFLSDVTGDMLLAGIQTVTGAKTFEDAKMLLRNVADTFNAIFTNTNTADRTYTLPDKNMTVAGTDDVDNRGQFLIIEFNPEGTDLAIATGLISFDMPNYATTLTDISVSVTTAPTGSVATFDLNEAGTTVLSTKVTIDATELTSETAATPPVISDSSLAANAVMSIDIDGIGSTIAGAGGKMIIYFNKA